MDSTSGFLGGTLGRVNQMVNSGRGNRKIMCYVILGVIIFAFILYSGMLAHYTKTYVLTKVVTTLKIPFYAECWTLSILPMSDYQQLIFFYIEHTLNI